MDTFVYLKERLSVLTMVNRFWCDSPEENPQRVDTRRRFVNQQKKQTILIVDDHSISRLALQSILDKAGYETALAVNGEEAWQLLTEYDIALVLADVCMPGINGFELCHRIKAHPEHCLTPVIMVTGADDIASRISAFEHGADEILPKPVINEELLARVRNLIRFSDMFAERLQMRLKRAELKRELAISKLKQEEEETPAYRNEMPMLAVHAAGGTTHTSVAPDENPMCMARDLDQVNRQLRARLKDKTRLY